MHTNDILSYLVALHRFAIYCTILFTVSMRININSSSQQTDHKALNAQEQGPDTPPNSRLLFFAFFLLSN